MKVANKGKSKIIKFLNGRAFYLILCLCFIAIGIAAWSGVEGMKNLSYIENQSDNTATDINNSSMPNLNANNQQQNNKPTTSSKDEVASKPKPEQPTEETSTAVAEFFVRPMLGEITKSYSDTELQYSATYNDMRLHKGLDIAGEAGDPVTACGAGTVTKVYNDTLYGTVVVIDHGNKIVGRYCGLNSNPAVKVGDTVDSSDRIGDLREIPCESSDPCHLHLEFTKNGKSIDPLKIFNK